MHSKYDNIEIMINDEADEVMKKLFDSQKNRYHNNLGSIKDTECVFNYVHLSYYKCHKINPNRGKSYIDSRDSIKNQKTTRNTILLIRCNSRADHKEITQKKDLQIKTKIIEEKKKKLRKII